MKILNNVALTALYTGNYAVYPRDYTSRGNCAFYVKYDKGDETSMELKLEYSNGDDVDGSEVWFQYSEIASGICSVKEVQFTATGLYRFELPGNGKEDKVKVSVKATGGTPTGHATIYIG